MDPSQYYDIIHTSPIVTFAAPNNMWETIWEFAALVAMWMLLWKAWLSHLIQAVHVSLQYHYYIAFLMHCVPLIVTKYVELTLVIFSAIVSRISLVKTGLTIFPVTSMMRKACPVFTAPVLTALSLMSYSVIRHDGTLFKATQCLWIRIHRRKLKQRKSTCNIFLGILAYL